MVPSPKGILKIDGYHGPMLFAHDWEILLPCGTWRGGDGGNTEDRYFVKPGQDYLPNAHRKIFHSSYNF